MATILPITTELGPASIAAVAEQRLQQSPYFFLKKLHCRYDSGTLTLSGSVPYRQLRQFAEAIVSRVPGVERVANEVEVFDPIAPASEARAARTAG